LKILVTGGAGFIGSHVVDSLVAQRHEVVILDNLSTGSLDNVNPRARLIEMDITDPRVADLFAEERFDIVDHHAAQVSVNVSVDAPIHDANVNILGSINLLQAAVANEVKKFIYISSGGAMYGEPERQPVVEDCPPEPLSPYGVSKHTVEHYLYLYHHIYGLRFTSLRYPNIYGPRQDPNGEAGVIAIFTGQMLHNQPVTINGTGEQLRDYLYVGDCVTANLLALHGGDGGMYNLGWGVGVSVNELIAQLSSLTGYTREPIHGPAKPGETFRIFLDAARAREELGWSPTVALHDGLRQTVEYFQQGR
jgi:UDP-glucose 4-epimerase